MIMVKLPKIYLQSLSQYTSTYFHIFLHMQEQVENMQKKMIMNPAGSKYILRNRKQYLISYTYFVNMLMFEKVIKFIILSMSYGMTIIGSQNFYTGYYLEKSSYFSRIRLKKSRHRFYTYCSFIFLPSVGNQRKYAHKTIQQKLNILSGNSSY